MVEIATKSGEIFGIPHKNTQVFIKDQDVAVAMSAMSGLAKNLALVGGGIALAALAVGVFAQSEPGKLNYSWRQLAKVKTGNRMFVATCLDEYLDLDVEGHRLTIPIDHITYYSLISKSAPHIHIKLVDGSDYWGDLIGPKHYTFMTSLGLQKVSTTEKHKISGMTFESAQKLKSRIAEFLEINALTAAEILGERNFNEYFVRHGEKPKPGVAPKRHEFRPS